MEILDRFMVSQKSLVTQQPDFTLAAMYDIVSWHAPLGG